jgi:hypothetical protein
VIKTWQERCEEHPDHEGIVTEQMIRERMQEEIDELRQALNVDAVNMSQERVDVPDFYEPMWLVDEKGNRQLVPRANRAPPKKEWVGLTAEEKYHVLEGATGDGGRVYYDTLFRSYEAKLKEKNGG